MPGIHPTTIHQICGLIADEIIQAAARSHSIDNLSVVVVVFKKFEDYINKGLQLTASNSASNTITNNNNGRRATDDVVSINNK